MTSERTKIENRDHRSKGDEPRDALTEQAFGLLCMTMVLNFYGGIRTTFIAEMPQWLHQQRKTFAGMSSCGRQQKDAEKR